MASTNAAARAPLGSISNANNNKRSAEEDSKPAAKLAPCAQRMKELEDARGDNKILMYMSNDILQCIPGKLGELKVDYFEEMDEKAKEAAYNALTQEQVDSILIS
jgi:hypothetical protein